MTTKKGFSLVEVLLATSIFALIVTALVGAWLYGQEATALAGKRARANHLVQEGLDASRNIRDDAFSNLADGTYGLVLSGGVWTLSGASDTVGEFTRTVSVATVDVDTKSITATVTWQQNAQRTGTATSVSYLADWQATKVGTGSGKGGLLVYADLSGADDVVRYKQFVGGTGLWGSELTVPEIGVPRDRDTRRVEVYASPTRTEAVLITKHVQAGPGDDTYIYGQVWDGTTWADLQLMSSWAGQDQPSARDFDGAYLDNGDFMLVYEDDTNTPKYRTWDGVSWSSESSTVDVGGNPAWIVVRQRPGTDQVMMAVKDQVSDTNTSFWNGATWGAVTEHATDSSADTIETLAFEWSPNATNLGALTFNDQNDEPLPNVQIYNSSTSTWGTNVENASVTSNVRAAVLAARSNATEWIGCFNDNNADINCLETDATPSWTSPTEIATATTGNQHTHTIAYEQVTSDLALSVYAEGPGAVAEQIPKWRTYDPSTNIWSGQNSLATLGAALEVSQVVPDPSGDDMLILMGDTSQDLWTIVWDGSVDAFYTTGGLAQTEHGTSGSNDIDQWFDFAWEL